MQDRAPIASRNVAIVPECRSQLERAGGRQTYDAGARKIDEALRRHRARDRHKEEERQGGTVAEQQDGCQPATTDRRGGCDAG